MAYLLNRRGGKADRTTIVIELIGTGKKLYLCLAKPLQDLVQMPDELVSERPGMDGLI